MTSIPPASGTHPSNVSNELDALRARFAVPGVGFDAGTGGLPRVVVDTPAASAHVYLHGAHVTHYQPKGEAPVLFMSGKSQFAAGKAIRGGVPVIFPWFGGKAAAPAHGFARTAAWALTDVTPADGGALRLTFSLGPSDTTRRQWPHEFEATYAVTVGPALEMEVRVRNPASAPGAFKFEEALHTYLAVGDVRQVTIDGLGGREFIDKVDGGKPKTQPPGPFQIEGETDRVYLGTPDTVTVVDPAGPGLGRLLSVSKQGSAATVVWNPWIAKARAMSDFGDDEWPAMLCVETANVADAAVTLQPGQEHVMRAAVRVG